MVIMLYGTDLTIYLFIYLFVHWCLTPTLAISQPYRGIRLWVGLIRLIYHITQWMDCVGLTPLLTISQLYHGRVILVEQSIILRNNQQPSVHLYAGVN